MTAGVSDRDRGLIGKVLAPYADCIERASIFGSRALGNARANSDIDLVLYGNLTEQDIDRLWTMFDESALSVSVDVVAYSDELYPALKRHIDAVAMPLFTRVDLVTP